MNINSLILNVDSYKASHWLQYPPNTETVFSYVEARGGKYDQTVVFGLQIFLKEVLSKPITMQDIDEAETFWAAHGEPFNRAGWEQIIKKHDGFLPLVIRCVPEGTVVPIRNIIASVENTDPEFYWLPSYVETAVLRALWYGTTVATNSWNIKQLLHKFLNETADSDAGLAFSLHDFGARGVSSFESAGIGGAAHLINFMGTDTVTGALFAMKYYGGQLPVGFSIPAMEHSSVTTWGRDGETAAFSNMIDAFGGEGKIIACVSDSYDIYNAVEHIWGGELREKVLAMGGRVVIRPDSSLGHPSEVVNAVVQLLDKQFGSSINSKGYKVLHPAVRVIQGDGVNAESITVILDELKRIGFSAENVVFGQGGALLQQVNRDTCKFAYKASAAKIGGEWIDVYKDPITDPGKRSKRGIITLFQNVETGEYTTDLISRYNDVPLYQEVLQTVFVNGKVVKEYTFDEVRLNSTL